MPLALSFFCGSLLNANPGSDVIKDKVEASLKISINQGNNFLIKNQCTSQDHPKSRENKGTEKATKSIG